MRKILFAALAICFPTLAFAANVPYLTGPFDPANLGYYLNLVIQGVNQNVGGNGMGLPRNFVDNGSMDVNQRAVTATCATTAGVIETSYSADRWGCDVNMASATGGQLAVVTSTPTPPVGFTNSQTLVRNSTSLYQPLCAFNEIPTIRATQLAGQTVDLSAYAQALAGLSADNGNQMQMFLLTGTGSNQGLGALRSAVGMTSTVKASSMTVSTTTGIITNASTVVAGQPVWMTAATMPTGFTSGQIYYVSSTNLSSGTSFSVAPTYAAAIAGTVTIPSTGGTTVVINIPAITPAWTGLAVYGVGQTGPGTSAQQEFGAAFSNPFTLSASAWTRVQTGPIYLPTTVTEAAVAMCFTPSAANAVSAGSTDGFAFVGVQLEILGANITSASPFEFRAYSQELADTLRYAWIIPEPAAAVSTPFTGFYATTTDCELSAQTPVPMDVIPAISFTGTTLGTTTFKIVNATGAGVALASTYLVSSTLSTPGLTSVRMASTTAGSTAGWGCQLIGNNAGAVINVGADF